MRKLPICKSALKRHEKAYAEGVSLGLESLANGHGVPFATGNVNAPDEFTAASVAKYTRKILELMQRFNIPSLVSMRPRKMIKFVSAFHSWYESEGFDDATRKEIKKVLSALFNYESFRDGKKYEVENGKIIIAPGNWCSLDYLEMLGAKWCCYCNDGHLYTKTLDGGRPAMRSPFDHYFPRRDFPMLGLTLLNLVPVCHDCNSGRKGERYFDVAEYAYPYLDDFHNSCEIAVDMKGNGIRLFLHKGNVGDVSISFKGRDETSLCKKTEKFLRDIKVERLYDDDLQDEALRFIRNIETFPDSRRRFLLKTLGTIEAERMASDHFGVTLNPANINKDRLGKMAIDIVREFAPRRWWGDLCTS